MIRKTLAAFATLIVVGLVSTACTNVSAVPSPEASEDAPVAVAPSTQPTPEPTSSAPLTDAELTELQLEKFTYMQSPERIKMFEESGYAEAKLKIATDALAGTFGTPKIEDILIFDQPAYSVEVGSFDDPSQLYIWFTLDPNPETGAPDPTTVWNYSLQVPGQPYVSITDTVHDWPTTINGSSVDLKYGVSIGVSNYNFSAQTCIWPGLEEERSSCQESNNKTKTVSDMELLDKAAIEAMQESLATLYGSDQTA